MSYRVRMSAEVGEWLTAVRDADPAVAAAIGEAAALLYEGGAALGPPRVRPLAEVLAAEAPIPGLDLAYQDQLVLQQRVRGRSAGPAVEKLFAEVEAFRTRKETAKARHTLALALQEIDESDDELAAAEEEIAGLLAETMRMPVRYGVATPLAEMYELRPESPDLRLLFGEPGKDVGILLVVGMARDDWAGWYAEAAPMAWDDLNSDEHPVEYDRDGLLAALR